MVQPWTLAANADFAYPQTKGERPADLAERAQYAKALDALCEEDVDLQILVTEVFNLVKPLAALRANPLRARVIAQIGKQCIASQPVRV